MLRTASIMATTAATKTVSSFLKTRRSQLFVQQHRQQQKIRWFSQQKQQSKRPRPSFEQHHGTGVEGVWYTSRSATKNPKSSSAAATNLDMGRYGLHRLDYSKIDPTTATWIIPPHPPTKSIQERLVFPFTLLVVGGFGLWAYLNPEEDDMADYWKRVETGQILLDDDDDDDDDDDFDDDDDE